MKAFDLGAEADLFVEELFGESASPAATLPAGFSGREPFFGDDRHDCWKVVARPGSHGTDRFSGIRPTDLVVRRSSTGDGVSWTCMPASSVDQRSIYLPGSDDLLREDVVVLRRVRRRKLWPLGEASVEDQGELIEVPGFFGPNNVRRTEQEIRDAVATRANAEWTAWHTAAGTSRPEGDAGMFGRLVGYYAAAFARLMPDTLTSVQSAALTANYTTFLAAGATPATVAAEATRLAGVLLAATPDATSATALTDISTAIRQAREAHTDSGNFAAWSAAFVTTCVRGAAIAQGLEAVIPPGRRHVGQNELLLASLMHAGYTLEARRRRVATTPRRRGTYHAFEPRERPPRIADIIVQDRRRGITAAQVTTLATLSAGLITHGDIVVDVQPGFLITVGGNLGDSSRRRRYPLDNQGLLVIDRRQLFTQEDNSGTLPALPAQTALPLAVQSTARIFALLSPVEEHAALPGQPYGGGTLT